MKVSRFWSITSIIRKDVKLFSRDFFFIFLSTLSLITFVTLYWVIPRDVDETISIGVRGPDIRTAFSELAGEEEGMAFTWYSGTESLKQAVENKDIEIGLDFPDGFVADLSSGKGVRVTVFVRPNLPPEYSDAMSGMVREIAYAVAGYRLPVSEPDEDVIVLGVDRAGNQVPIRDKLRPLYAFMMLIMEAISLGALIASEIQERTLTALLSSPARIGDVLAAKIILGTAIAFSEAIIITLLIRGFGASPGIVILALFLGAVLVTGIAMIAGSAGKDIMATMIIGILILIPLAIPAFAVLFPGEPATWVKVLPSYGIVQAIVGSSIEGTGWLEASRYLLILAGWCLASAMTGALVLKRKAVTL
jgi:ABC-2 type transport system permease protein